MPAELFRRGCLTFNETFSVAVFFVPIPIPSENRKTVCRSRNRILMKPRPISISIESSFQQEKRKLEQKKKFGRKLKLAEFNGSSDLVPCPWQRGSVVCASVTSVVTTPLGVNGWPKTMDGE